MEKERILPNPISAITQGKGSITRVCLGVEIVLFIFSSHHDLALNNDMFHRTVSLFQTKRYNAVIKNNLWGSLCLMKKF